MKATKVLSLLALGLLVTSCGGNSNTLLLLAHQVVVAVVL